jgi:hypothetical protein
MIAELRCLFNFYESLLCDNTVVQTDIKVVNTIGQVNDKHRTGNTLQAMVMSAPPELKM